MENLSLLSLIGGILVGSYTLIEYFVGAISYFTLTENDDITELQKALTDRKEQRKYAFSLGLLTVFIATFFASIAYSLLARIYQIESFKLSLFMSILILLSFIGLYFIYEMLKRYFNNAILVKINDDIYYLNNQIGDNEYLFIKIPFDKKQELILLSKTEIVDQYIGFCKYSDVSSFNKTRKDKTSD